jgi:hypothetical protein
MAIAIYDLQQCPKEKQKICSAVGGVGRAVEFDLGYEMSVTKTVRL